MAGDASKKNYSYLSQMSTEELETILRSSALSEEADDPDLVDHILEVIMLREKNNNDVLAIEQARKDFDKFYRNLDEPLYPIAEDEGETAVPDKPHLTVSRTQKRRIKHVLIAAAVIAVLVSLAYIPVLGYNNIIQMVAYWTAEQFGFHPAGQTPATENNPRQTAPQQVPKEYSELQEIMLKYGVELVVPSFPEGFEVGEPVLSYYPEDNVLKFHILFHHENDYFIFGVNRDSDQNTSSYEKNTSLVETSLYNGIKHYFLENTDNNTVVWHLNELEHYIVTNMQFSDLKEILESMYEV